MPLSRLRLMHHVATLKRAVPAPAAMPAADGGRNGIRLGFLIHDVSRLRKCAYDQVMRPHGITRAQWWVMAHLSRADGMMQTRIAEQLDVGKASLGDVLTTLEAAGWVRREPDPDDRRMKRVHLTTEGLALVARMTHLEQSFNAQILQDLSAAEVDALTAALGSIKRALLTRVPAALADPDD